MSSNFSVASSLRLPIFPTLLLILLAISAPSCSSRGGEGQASVTVSNPAMSYFVCRLAPPEVKVNVMIPQGADHDTYTPRPSQMASLASSAAYIAYGPLEFETTWKDRILSTAPGIKWCDVSDGIDLITGGEATSCQHHTDGHDHTAADPHFWLSPRQAAIMSRNVSVVLKSVFPSSAEKIDSALSSLLQDVSTADSALAAVAAERSGETFVVYHPALSYVARDYGFRQLSLGSEATAPTPRLLAAYADSARRAGARVFFLQPGVTPDRVESLADEMKTDIVTLQPESADWPKTMRTITDALR